MALTAPLSLPGHLLAGITRPLGDMLGSAPGLSFDFTTPLGEAALIPADSVSWRIFKNPVTLFVGGISAVLMELAEPSVRDGVWQHSSFRTDALTRMRRTGLAAMVTVYGPKSRAEAMIAGVVRAHGRVSGVTSEGTPYHANDPVLLDWVQATASYGFITAYHRFASTLTQAERDSAYADGSVAARLYGAVGAPTSEAQMAALVEQFLPRLVPSPIIAEFLGIMQTVPAFPRIARPFQHMLLRAAVDLLPDPLVGRLGLEKWRLGPVERRIVQAAARLADRFVLPTAPPAQSCRRLGLPANLLYR